MYNFLSPVKQATTKITWEDNTATPKIPYMLVTITASNSDIPISCKYFFAKGVDKNKQIIVDNNP